MKIIDAILSPFHVIGSFVRWRRLDRQETVVAIAVFRTTSDSNSEEFRSQHVVRFLVDGNGLRFSRMKTSLQFDADTHDPMLVCRERWAVLGELPKFAERPNQLKKAELIVFPGGGNAA